MIDLRLLRAVLGQIRTVDRLLGGNSGEAVTRVDLIRLEELRIRLGNHKCTVLQTLRHEWLRLQRLLLEHLLLLGRRHLPHGLHHGLIAVHRLHRRCRIEADGRGRETEAWIEHHLRGGGAGFAGQRNALAVGVGEFLDGLEVRVVGCGDRFEVGLLLLLVGELLAEGEEGATRTW